MYCVKCGVKLADTEKKCPLCNTVVYHPELTQPEATPLYPENKRPPSIKAAKTLSGVILFVFLIPLIISFFADLLPDGRVDWFGYVAGALVVGYVMVALPLWFQRPNPVIFVPCSFAAVAAYLLYLDLVTAGSWFLSLALPTIGGLALITCTVVTLVYYLGKGKLYIFGGAFMALGTLLLMVEYLLTVTFQLNFIGWSVYPLIVLSILGGLMIYLAIDKNARETMERKLFF